MDIKITAVTAERGMLIVNGGNVKGEKDFAMMCVLAQKGISV